MTKKLLMVMFVLFCFSLQAQMLTSQKQGKLWGFVDEHEVFVVQPTYTACGDFLSGYTWTNLGGKCKFSKHPIGGKWGIIDDKGKEIVAPKYDYVDLCYEDIVAFNMGGKMVGQTIVGGLWGFIDLKTGQEIVPAKYDQVGAFCADGVAWVHKGNQLTRKLAFDINKNAKGKIENETRHFDIFGDYKIDEQFVHYNASGLWALLDAGGNELTPFLYNGTGDFNSGVSWVAENGKYGAVNSTGKVIVKCMYENMSETYDNGLFWAWEKFAGDNSKIALIDKTGKVITPFKYAKVDHFNEGVAWASSNAQKFCLINEKGEELSKERFDKYGEFYNGICPIYVNNAIGYINTQGKEITRTIYSEVQEFFGKDSPIRFNMNNNETILGWVLHPTLGLSWIDHDGNVIVTAGKKTYDIKDEIPEGLWDY